MSGQQLVDWSLVVLLVQRHTGMSRTTLGRSVGSDERHIGRLARREVLEPRFGTGVRLLDLAYDVLPADVFSRIRQ